MGSTTYNILYKYNKVTESKIICKLKKIFPFCEMRWLRAAESLSAIIFDGETNKDLRAGSAFTTRQKGEEALWRS